MYKAPSVPRRGRVVLVIASAILVAACSAAASPIAPGGGDASSSPGAPAGRPSDLPVPPLVTVPPSEQPIVGEAPAELMTATRADLAGRVSAAAASGAIVIRSEAIQWPDGSLGCPVPGELYPQVITPGYWIVLDVDGSEYDYRATEAGAVRLCEQGLRPNPGG